MAVSRGVNVLAEHTDPSHRGNYETVTRSILRRVAEGGSRLAQLKYDDHNFFYSIVEGVTYVVMTAETAGSRLPVAFLEDVTRAFRGAYRAAWKLSSASSTRVEEQHSARSGTETRRPWRLLLLR